MLILDKSSIRNTNIKTSEEIDLVYRNNSIKIATHNNISRYVNTNKCLHLIPISKGLQNRIPKGYLQKQLLVYTIGIQLHPREGIQKATYMFFVLLYISISKSNTNTCNSNSKAIRYLHASGYI